MAENLKRFLEAQERTYFQALEEVKHGRKQSHWMWFIFPQIAGLARSETASFYAIRGLDEAERYLAHPILGRRLIEITKHLLAVKHKTASEIFGSPDDLKLRSCMTLFGSLQNADPVFQKVIDRYFAGQMDVKTLELISR